ncbi:GIY-YIG nuclease family protein [Nonomuraea sp. NPDC046802]|uniref:GIY-YIG nuclease family protein n=1 Tax=Nonomuraea sp. NPDC046802 TaxID=3154919 RepID=UPI0033EDB7B8
MISSFSRDRQRVVPYSLIELIRVGFLLQEIMPWGVTLARANGPRAAKRPAINELPAPIVRNFREALSAALSEKDDLGRVWANAKWGAYAFYDYDGEPIYVGQTNELLRTRIRRHLTNQRTDAVAMRILDVFEVAELEVWPLWHLDGPDAPDKKTAKKILDGVEYSAYLESIKASKFKAILNEKIPPISDPVELPPSCRFQLIDPRTREERGHPDTRIARRAETLARLTAVAHERGEVTPGLRRVIVIQAIRLAFLAATRLAHVEGRADPEADAIDMHGLIGSVLAERGDPDGPTDQDLMLFGSDEA